MAKLPDLTTTTNDNCNYHLQVFYKCYYNSNYSINDTKKLSASDVKIPIKGIARTSPISTGMQYRHVYTETGSAVLLVLCFLFLPFLF